EREDRDPGDEGGSEQRSEGEGEAAHRVVRRGKPLTRLRLGEPPHVIRSSRPPQLEETEPSTATKAFGPPARGLARAVPQGDATTRTPTLRDPRTGLRPRA